MKLTIFYSWQSDKPNKINRDFIQSATMLAIDRIVSNDDFEVDPVLDRDTLGVSGSPAIAQSILEKIENCSLFLCDVTIVSEANAKRIAPNPNVLIELGYAAAKIGWERIICVMNENYGGPTKLPFDLQHRRWPIRYGLSPNANDETIKLRLANLSESIEYAIQTVLQSGILITSVNPKDARVATKFEHALGMYVGTLAQFLTSRGYGPAMNVVEEDHPDDGSGYPPAVLVDPILKVLAENSLKEPSFRQIGDRVLPWTEALVSDLVRSAQECNRILDQYADRDDRLISIIDEMITRSENVAKLINTCVNVPTLTFLYDKGVPDVHMEFFKYFLLATLKSYRVLREFK